MNTKHKTHEENHTKAHHNQIAKTSDKEKTLQVAKEKRHIIHREVMKTTIADFLSESMQVRRQWSNISKVLKGKKSTYSYIPSANIFQKRQNNNYFRHMKAERLYR